MSRKVVTYNFAQLGVHKAVFNIVECLIEYQQENTFEDILRLKPEIEEISAKFVEFVGSDFV